VEGKKKKKEEDKPVAKNEESFCEARAKTNLIPSSSVSGRVVGSISFCLEKASGYFAWNSSRREELCRVREES